MFHTQQNQLQNNKYLYLYVEYPPRLKAILGTSDPVMTVIWHDRLYHTISGDRHILYRVFVLPISQDDMVLHSHDCFFRAKKPCVGSVSPSPSLVLSPLFVIVAYPRTICILAIRTVWACHAAVLLGCYCSNRYCRWCCPSLWLPMEEWHGGGCLDLPTTAATGFKQGCITRTLCRQRHRPGAHGHNGIPFLAQRRTSTTTPFCHACAARDKIIPRHPKQQPTLRGWLCHYCSGSGSCDGLSCCNCHCPNVVPCCYHYGSCYGSYYNPYSSSWAKKKKKKSQSQIPVGHHPLTYPQPHYSRSAPPLPQ